MQEEALIVRCDLEVPEGLRGFEKQAGLWIGVLAGLLEFGHHHAGSPRCSIPRGATGHRVGAEVEPLSIR